MMSETRRMAWAALALATAGLTGTTQWVQAAAAAAPAFTCQPPASALSARPDPRPLPSLEDEPGVVYVAPEGRDDWSGREASPAFQDGPVATLTRARDIARTNPAVRTIVLRGGDYWLDAPVAFGPEDRGLTLRAAPGEAPVLHGGPLVTGWVEDADCRWSAPLALPEDVSPGALVADGTLQVQARLPDRPEDGDPRKGWLFAAAPAAGDEWGGNLHFRFHPGDIPALSGTDGLVAHIVGGFNPTSQWGSDTLPVTGIDAGNNVVTTLGTSYFFTGDGSRYFLAGRPEFLDAPHEWWYDRAARRIRYIPPPDASPRTISIGTLPTLLTLDGADGMTITGLTLRDGSPVGTGKVGTDTRGGGAIRVMHSADVRIDGNGFENVGVAIHVSESPRARITGNRVSHVAGNGIYLGTEYGSFGRSDDALVSGNQISDIGEVYFESAGIWFQATSGTRVAHNLIERAAQFGIAGGSLWGTEDAVYDAVIEGNDVRDANRETADGGAIKMMGAQADPMRSVIRGNRVSGTGELMNRPDGTFWPARYENVDEWPTPISWAIYLDGKASGVTIEQNLVVGNIAGIGVNGGWNNVIRGNIVAAGTGSAIRIDDGTGRDWTPSWAEANLVTGNILEAPLDGMPLAYVYAPGHGATYARFARNLYTGPVGGKSFKVWPEVMAHGSYGGPADLAAAGLDEGSVAGDPRFTDPGAGDFRLGAESAATPLGIADVPVATIGLAGARDCSAQGC